MSSSVAWMERLRSKSSQLKSWTEQSKLLKNAIADPRFNPDAEELSNIRTCLDHLSDAIPVRDVTSMAEKIETIARRITLESGGTVTLNSAAPMAQGCVYLSTDIFYIEIKMDPSGIVIDAKIMYSDAMCQSLQTSQSVPEIVQSLSQGNFMRFKEHLEGLVEVYKLTNTQAHEKTQAWMAIIALEADLHRKYMDEFKEELDVYDLLHKTPLGVMEKRSGGIPMRLRYFVSPEDLMDFKTGTLKPYSEIEINEDLGLWVTIGIESSPTPKKLSVTPNTEGEDFVLLPARFVARLNKPMPLSHTLASSLASRFSLPFMDGVQTTPLMQLIIENGMNEMEEEFANSNCCSKGHFVKLPGCDLHCYVIKDKSQVKGVMIDSIPFTHYEEVDKIIDVLRQQALFNKVITSCVRPFKPNYEIEKAILFEVSAVDPYKLAVSFETLRTSSMASVMFDLRDMSEIKCTEYSLGQVGKAALVLQKTLSLPVTMRAILQNTKCRTRSDNEVDGAMSGNGHNGNIRDPNQNFHPMDFGMNRNGDLALDSEPMEFENGSKLEDPLNTFGPQDATFNPGASAKTYEAKNEWGTSHQARSIESSIVKRTSSDSSKLINCPEIKIDSFSPTPSPKLSGNEVRKDGTSKTSMTVKMSTQSLVSSGRSGYKGTTSSSSSLKQNPKSSVSILPLGSADAPTSTPSTGLKKSGGIEIIPLEVAPGESLESKLQPAKPTWPKEVRRSLSEDDRRKLDRKDGSGSKKRKHDFDRRKKSSSPVSPNSKRSMLDGSDKSKSKSLTITKISSSTSPSNKIKFPTVGGDTSTSSAIEILPTGSTLSGGGSSPPPKSSSGSGSGSSGSGSASKDRTKSESPGLKLTIKNSGSGSSSSSSKHRSSEHYHKSSSSSSKSGSSKSSSNSSRSRPSSSSSNQKYSSYKASSNSPSSSSKHSSGSSSSHKARHDKDRDRDRERAEEVKRMLGANKLNTTFQIPKLSSKHDEGSVSGTVSSTVTSSSNSSGSSSKSYGQVSSSTSRPPPPPLPSSSTVYSSGSTTPKYSSSGTPSASPKHFLHGSSGAMVSPKLSSTGSTTPPNISPKHPGSSSSTSKKTPSSSPTHGSQQSSSSSIKIPPLPVSFPSPGQSRSSSSSSGSFQPRPSSSRPDD